MSMALTEAYYSVQTDCNLQEWVELDQLVRLKGRGKRSSHTLNETMKHNRVQRITSDTRFLI